FSALFFSPWALMDPYGRDGVREHPRGRTRSGGTDRARHRPAETVRVSAGNAGAARPPSIRRNRPRATRASAWIRPAATYEAGARSLLPIVGTRAGGPGWRGGWARQ